MNTVGSVIDLAKVGLVGAVDDVLHHTVSLQWQPFEDGDELRLSHFVIGMPDGAKLRYDPNVTFDIAFDSKGQAAGLPFADLPLMKTLLDCRSAVEEAILRLEPFLP